MVIEINKLLTPFMVWNIYCRYFNKDSRSMAFNYSKVFRILDESISLDRDQIIEDNSTIVKMLKDTDLVYDLERIEKKHLYTKNGLCNVKIWEAIENKDDKKHKWLEERLHFFNTIRRQIDNDEITEKLPDYNV